MAEYNGSDRDNSPGRDVEQGDESLQLGGAQAQTVDDDSDGSKTVVANRGPVDTARSVSGARDKDPITQSDCDEGGNQKGAQDNVLKGQSNCSGPDNDCSIPSDSKLSGTGRSKEEVKVKQAQEKDRGVQAASLANYRVQTVGDKSDVEMDGDMREVLVDPINHYKISYNRWSLKDSIFDAMSHAQATSAPPDGGHSLDDLPGYTAWRQFTLDYILLGEHSNRFPVVEEPYADNEERPIEPKELRPDHRALNFFMHMFDGYHEYIHQTMTREETPNDRPGQVLQSCFDTLCKNFEVVGVAPSYTLSQVFSSPHSPLPNFSLASKAFGQGLQMLHRSQVNFSGVGAATVVVCGERRIDQADPTKRTLTAQDVSFVNHDDTVYKRGGRVYSVEIHHPDVAILGEERGFNTASISMEVMLCDAAACVKCSPGSTIDTSATCGMPRVHFRHLGRPGNRFTQKDPNPYGFQNEDTGDEFPDYTPTSPDDVVFWDGSTQKVTTCIGLVARFARKLLARGMSRRRWTSFATDNA